MTISKTGQTRTKTDNVARKSGGFTLLEVLLAVSILVFLVGVTAFGLRSLSSSGSVSDAVENFAVGLRMARAEAASQGKRCQITFDNELGGKILVENKPISAPGQFVEYAACTWSRKFTDPRIRITTTKITKAGAFNAIEQFGDVDDTEETFQAITFNADGSSDSAEITLVPIDESDTRIFTIQLDGLNGKTTVDMKYNNEEGDSESDNE